MYFFFDFIGYWSAVTLYVSILLYPVLFFGVILLDQWVYYITDKDKINYVSGLIPDCFKWEEHQYIVPVIVSLFLSALFWILGVVAHELRDITYLEMIQRLSEKSTPFFSWGVSTIVLLVIVHFVAKKGYNISKSIKQLENKCK